MATYTVKFSVAGFKKLDGKLAQIEEILSSKELYEYIAERCMKALNEITLQKLSSYGKENIDTSYYASRHQYKIEGSTIYIFNDSKNFVDGLIFCCELVFHFDHSPENCLKLF